MSAATVVDEEWEKYLDRVSETEGFDVDGVEFDKIEQAWARSSLIWPLPIHDPEAVACAHFSVEGSSLAVEDIVKATKECTITGRHYRLTFRASSPNNSVSRMYQARVLATWPRQGSETKRTLYFLRPIDKKKKRRRRSSQYHPPTRASPRLMEMRMKMNIANQNWE